MKKTLLLAFVLVLLSTTMSLCVVGFLGLRITYALPYTDINIETAFNMITNGSYPDLVILDVRRQNEYDTGHIVHAVLIPHTELDERIDELASHKDHETIVYCRAGGRSATASGILDSHNFTKVYNMLGGISAWQSAGYPIWNATVHNVNTTIDYDTIQAAIDAPDTLDGHTIFVEKGTYHEHIVVNKSISLIGENRSTTIVDGGGSGTVVSVEANYVTIENLTIRNSAARMELNEYDPAGISVIGCNSTRILNNNLTNNFYGIYLEYSSDNWIAQNKLTNSLIGINLLHSLNNNISRNNIDDNDQAMQIDDSPHNSLRDNLFNRNKLGFWISGWELSDFYLDIDVSNIIDGKPVYYWVNRKNETVPLDAGFVALVNCTRIEVTNLNVGGILLASTNHTRVAGNNVTNGGIQFEEISCYNNISGNTISKGWCGLWIQHSSHNSFANNVLVENEYGFGVIGDYANYIDQSNTVNGKPVYYLVNQHDLTIGPDTHPEIGYLAIINSTNIKISNLVENYEPAGNFQGILISRSDNVTIRYCEITNSRIGIDLHLSSNVTIEYNNVINGNYSRGIILSGCNESMIFLNNIKTGVCGIELRNSHFNSFLHNLIMDNNYIPGHSCGVYLVSGSHGNMFSDNGFFNNSVQVRTSASPAINFWDDGGMGNYWDDYEERYPNATEIDGTGIWNSPYIIDENNQDNYPIVPEFPSWAPMLLTLIVFTVVIAITKRIVCKTPMDR